MLKRIRTGLLQTKDGQMIASEYVIVLFVVVAMMTGMSLYFRRAIQGRIRDAHNAMFNIVKDRIGTAYAGNEVYLQYEPYFRDTDSTSLIAGNDTKQILPTYPLSSGLYRYTPNTQVRSSGRTTTLPPVNAN